MRLYTLSALVAGALLASGCTTTMRAGPVDVTRYHLGNPLAPGTVKVEPVSDATTLSLEFQSYAAAVRDGLARQGFTPAAEGAPTDYVAAVTFVRTSRGYARKPPPVTIGLGGGSYGSGGGVGVGGSFGIGGGRVELVSTELRVQLKRTTDQTVVWEGRAVTDEAIGANGQSTQATAARLAEAMFKGFPGESGITITVK
ncbi:DUF4136 domain-containing protein [Sphingomonas sp.]|uniref:DUF4136 domain-containing protein n=1 Tax=Sphingomonas sp. TaxID=28214 RepID=UPI001B2E2726|nr:DUF4136 domain-containing protein [Sphingomonas sp.]MBO9713113.1 DUF4136 domain-containing protein [Sphingomonas sp.]